MAQSKEATEAVMNFVAEKLECSVKEIQKYQPLSPQHNEVINSGMLEAKSTKSFEFRGSTYKLLIVARKKYLLRDSFHPLLYGKI